MKKLVCSLAAVALLATAVAYAAVTKETITVSSTAVGLSSATKTTAGGVKVVRCVGRVETAAIRYWTTGDAPTATEGIPLDTGDAFELHGGEIEGFKAIRQTSTDGKIQIECGVER
jgi:hypothetical protein